MLFKYFFGILTEKQKKLFFLYTVLLFLGSVSSAFGVGAVVPFVNFLLSPNKVNTSFSFLNLSHHALEFFLIALLVSAYWVKNVISVILLYFQSKFLNSIVESIQSRLFSKYLNMPYEKHLYRSTPALIRNLNNETTQFSGGVISPMGMMITDVFSVFFVMVVLFVFNSMQTAPGRQGSEARILSPRPNQSNSKSRDFPTSYQLHARNTVREIRAPFESTLIHA